MSGCIWGHRKAMNKLKVLIVDDETIVRQGLAGLLSLEPDIEVVGTAANGAAALDMAEKTSPDVVLMDIQMPLMNGVEATARLTQDRPKTKVLMLTTFTDDALIVQAMHNGAQGYLLKDCGGKQIAGAVRSVYQGFTTLSSCAVDTLVAACASEKSSGVSTSLVKLTAREHEVLSFLAQGLSNSEIAARIDVTEKTVRDHVSNILAALNLRDRTQAALWARSNLD